MGEGWLPAVVTRRAVDPADKKAEKVTAHLAGVPPAPPRRGVAVGIAGVSSPVSPAFRFKTAEVASFGKPLRHLTRVGGGCGNIRNLQFEVSMLWEGGLEHDAQRLGCSV